MQAARSGDKPIAQSHCCFGPGAFDSNGTHQHSSSNLSAVPDDFPVVNHRSHLRHATSLSTHLYPSPSFQPWQKSSSLLGDGSEDLLLNVIYDGSHQAPGRPAVRLPHQYGGRPAADRRTNPISVAAQLSLRPSAKRTCARVFRERQVILRSFIIVV